MSLAKQSEEESVGREENLVKVSSIEKDCQQLSESWPTAQSGHKLEMIWHLEIHYMDSAPGGLVLPHLLHWTSLHFTGCEERARSVLSQASEEPEQHAEYWEAVTRFVPQGKVEHARNLIKLHSEFSTDPLLSMDELFHNMPVCSSDTSPSDFEFR